MAEKKVADPDIDLYRKKGLRHSRPQPDVSPWAGIIKLSDIPAVGLSLTLF